MHTKEKHLILIGTKYYFRTRVPTDLQHFLKSPFIKKSPKTNLRPQNSRTTSKRLDDKSDKCLHPSALPDFLKRANPIHRWIPQSAKEEQAVKPKAQLHGTRPHGEQFR
jgi:hypothetical protein